MNINEETATKIMGWEKDGTDWLKDGKHTYFYTEPIFGEEEVWAPDEDLNQADMVKRKGIEVLMELAPPTHSLGDAHRRFFAMNEIDIQLHRIMGEADADYLWLATAEQICQAVLMAVEVARGKE